jgi:4'-phosphopantetheinyl transferase
VRGVHPTCDLEPVRFAVRPRSADCPDARALLRDLLGFPADVATRPGGQPCLPDHPGLGVSMSHDGDWLAVAVGLGVRVGIDVQCPQRLTAGRLRWAGSARIALAALPDAERDREYARIWTVQEACVKAAGSGLAGQPWTIPVAVGQTQGEWQGYQWFSLAGTDTAVPVSLAHGHVVSR